MHHRRVLAGEQRVWSSPSSRIRLSSCFAFISFSSVFSTPPIGVSCSAWAWKGWFNLCCTGVIAGTRLSARSAPGKHR